MIPRAKIRKANWPAIGRSASAAWDDVWMSVMPVRFQRRRCGDHDEQSDDVRKRHAEVGVDPYPPKLAGRLLRRLLQRLRVRPLLHLVDLLFGLPEEKVWADRRAEDGDDEREVARGERDVRNDQVVAHRTPGGVDDERHRDVGEE